MNNLMPESDKQKIIKKLQEKGVKIDCPMCGHNNFIIADGYFNNPMQSDFQGGLVLGGPSIPTIAIVCGNCGFISQHALGVLGLLIQNDKK
jgi:transcription elongation factor Elf1